MKTARAGHTATLLHSANVVVIGGESTGSVEIYNPATDTWEFTEPLNTARAYHSATLLANGKVLLAGGSDYIVTGDALPSLELYDPLLSTLELVGNQVKRMKHTATLLNDGSTLIVGGYTGGLGGTILSSVQRYERGDGFDPHWPLLDSINDPLYLGENLIVNAAGGLRGYSESSSGTTSNSATDYPVVQLVRMDNQQTLWLPWEPTTTFSTTQVVTVPVIDFHPGPARVTVFVNSIPSYSMATTVAVETVSPPEETEYFAYLPLLER
jgi:hypothetical protein